MAAWGTTRRAVTLAALLPLAACTTVDPGTNFVVPNETFDADYFYCHVEPQLIVTYRCGPGDPAKGDASNSCHFSPSVSGMALLDHAPVDCGGGDHPLDLTQIGTGGAAEIDLVAVSGEMLRDYRTAPLFVRPSGNNHPRAVFDRSDPVVTALLSAWASK